MSKFSMKWAILKHLEESPACNACVCLTKFNKMSGTDKTPTLTPQPG